MEGIAELAFPTGLIFRRRSASSPCSSSSSVTWRLRSARSVRLQFAGNAGGDGGLGRPDAGSRVLQRYRRTRTYFSSVFSLLIQWLTAESRVVQLRKRSENIFSV